MLQSVKKATLESSPSYASRRNGQARHFVQKLSLCGSVVLTSTDIPDTLWDKDIHHENWLRICFLSKSIPNYVLISKWRINFNTINFSTLPTFG